MPTLAAGRSISSSRRARSGLVTAGRFMRYGTVNDLPASVKAAEHDDGGVYRAILESTDQGYCTIEVAFDENEKPVD